MCNAMVGPAASAAGTVNPNDEMRVETNEDSDAYRCRIGKVFCGFGLLGDGLSEFIDVENRR